MADLKYYDVILKPVISEKSMAMMADKKYTFLVHVDANKAQIKEAVEKMFDGTKVENYELHLCGATTAEIVEFANKQDLGIHSALTVGEDGKVTVNVSECPIIILAE